jgi:hypothetical protein
MKKLFPTLILLLCGIHYSIAQSYTIKGIVSDTLNSNPLHRASVVLIRTSDTVIQSFTRTAPDGHFETTVPAAGKYVLQVTFPGFADYVETVNLKKTTTDMGVLPMVTKSHLLQEFVLKQQIAAIKIKGDTTEYMADSFKVKENATVEDLLKKLPGIQVDKNGQITAQGETVQKILVDGEEFFSDDPKVVTKGLAANAVSKVQVFDKKSEQAEFTGIDDGEKQKTINLELKEDKKKGFFGKVDAGGGTDGYFQNQAMINAFKAKRQVSVFGIASNTDKAGLGWQDADKFGSGNGTTTITDDGDVMTYYSGSDDDFSGGSGRYRGEGLPKTWTGGVHYADKWNEGKNHVTGNYRYGQQIVELDGETTVQRILADSSNINDQKKTQFSRNDRHGADVMYDGKIDSNTTLKVTATAGQKNTDVLTDYNTISFTQKGDAGSDTLFNHRTITSNGDAQFINADLTLRKKFAKKGRTLSFDAKENYKDSKTDGILKSVFSNDTPSINQKKLTNTNTLAFSAKATYTEPISKVAFIEGDYSVTVNNSTSSNFSLNKSAGGEYDVLDSNYSSNYKFNVLTNRGGLNMKFVFKKVSFNFGGDVSNAAYLQTDLLHGDTTHTYNYVNLFPKANLNYKLGKQTSLSLQYNGYTTQPTINQIQPLQQNNDPLNVIVGNPALKQSFTNNFNLHFNDYKMLSGTYIWSNFNFTTTSNAITTEQTTTGPYNSTQYINMDGSYAGWGYMGYGKEFKKINTNAGLQFNGSINHTNNIINGQTNTSDYSSLTFGGYANYEKEEKFDFGFNPDFTYNINKSSISDVSSNYWVFSAEFNGTVQLPKKFEIGSSADFMIREKTAVFTGNNNVIKWNAFVGKKFLKKDQLELKLSVFDILNQNLGFSRNAQPNLVTQNTYNTIRRYGMINLIWNFTHTPAGVPQAPAGGGIIINN